VFSRHWCAIEAAVNAAPLGCIASYTMKKAHYVADSGKREQTGLSQHLEDMATPSTGVPRISAAQLAKEVGCSVRRVRDFVQLGLVGKAVGQGRARRYTQDHVEQLKAVMHALDEAAFTRAELLWVLDRETPSRLRRQAREVELLAGPREGRARVHVVQVEGRLTFSVAGSIALHERRLLTNLVATIARELRARADFAEEWRAQLAVNRSGARPIRSDRGPDNLGIKGDPEPQSPERKS
jgi:DNA-binding transcriptional MerR regulator